MRSVALNDVLRAVKGQGTDGAAVFANHHLCHARSLEYRLRCGLGSRTKQAGHGIVYMRVT